MQYAPTVLIVHPRQGIAKGLASILQDYGFHALPLWNAVDAIEHVENLFFDVAVVSDEMPSALPELLFQANGGEWLEVLSFHTPENNVWAEFMLTVTFPFQLRGWYGEAGYEPGSSWTAKLTEAEWDAKIEELEQRVSNLIP